MKKLICIILILLTLALSACGAKPAVEPTVTGSPEVTAPPEVSETQKPEPTDTETEPVEPSETPQPTETPKPSEAPVIEAKEPAVINLTLCPDGVAIPLPEENICTLDKDGAQILITVIGDANNVRLCRADYDGDMNFLGPGEVLYDAGNITEAGEFGLRVFIPDVCPNVLLCYTDSEGEHVYGIFQSGEDGSLFLLDMDMLFGAM